MHVKPEAEGRGEAERFRQNHHLGAQPLGDLVAVIEQATGIDVAVLDVGPDEHGMTMRDPERDAVFIGVARTRKPMRQRSTLAHELGHVLFGDWADTPSGGLHSNSQEETRANAFARHLLVPLDGLREFLEGRKAQSPSTLSAVVQRYLVSPAVAAIALHQSGFINATTKHEWMSQTTPRLAIQFGWSDQYHALQEDADRRRAPQRLLARATAAYTEGVLSAQTIATLRGISVAGIETELREAGLAPAEKSVPWTNPAELPDADVDLDALDVDLNAPAADGGSTDQRVSGNE